MGINKNSISLRDRFPGSPDLWKEYRFHVSLHPKISREFQEAKVFCNMSDRTIKSKRRWPGKEVKGFIIDD